MSTFKNEINHVLGIECSAFRFLGNIISPIVDEIEIQEVELSINNEDAAAKHMRSAVQLFSDRENKQYRECCHQAISAVESIAKKVTGKSGDTLSKLINSLNLSKPFAEGLNKIYGYTSNEKSGVRHGGIDEMEDINIEDARFLLVMCSAFLNYIRSKNP